MKRIIAIAIILAITACTLPNGKPSATADIAVKLATLELIDNSGRVTKDGVLSRVNLARKLLETEITLAYLTEKVRDSVDWDGLSPSERLLVDALIADIVYTVPVEVDIPLDAEQKAKLLHVLDLIEQGAAYAE